MKSWWTLASLMILFVSASFPQNASQSIAPPGMIVGLLALNHDLPTAAKPKYLSPCDLVASPDGQYLYVAEQTAKRIAVVSLSTQTVIKEILLPNEVTGIAVAPNGLKLYATCSSDLWPNGMVCEVDIAAGKVTRRLPAGHGARSPVISHNGKTLYVCNQYGNDVYVVDLASGTLTKKIAVLREPYAAAITPDDSMLVVTNSIPVQKSTDNLNVASQVLLIKTSQNEIDASVSLPTGSHSMLGVTVSPDGKYAFATHLIGGFTMPVTKIDGGWVHTNNFAIIDIKNRKILNDFMLDNSSSGGSANPWGIGCTKDNSKLCVVHSGSNEMSVINMQSLLDSASAFLKRDTLFNPQGGAQGVYVGFSHNLSVLRDIRWKVPVAGKSPRALAIIGTRAYAAGYFGETVEVYDLTLDSQTAFKGTIRLDGADTIPWTGERTGEFHFFNADLCYQGWHTCHSCHQSARTDGLNWILAGDVNAPKNTKSFLYSWWTPKTNWAGKRESAWESIRFGMKNELFIEPLEAAAVMMDTFFIKMKPIQSPRLEKGNLSLSAQKGKDVFIGKAGCGACHPGPLFTDLKLHTLGIEDSYDATTKWDTPSLIESWHTAPYGHLGNFLTIQEMLDLPQLKSVKATLSEEEIDQLVEYVLSL